MNWKERSNCLLVIVAINNDSRHDHFDGGIKQQLYSSVFISYFSSSINWPPSCISLVYFGTKS